LEEGDPSGEESGSTVSRGSGKSQCATVELTKQMALMMQQMAKSQAESVSFPTSSKTHFP